MKTRGVSNGLYFRTFQQVVPPPGNIESGGFGGVASLLRSAGGSIILSIYCLASFRRPRYCSCPSIVWPVSSGVVNDLYSREATRISDVIPVHCAYRSAETRCVFENVRPLVSRAYFFAYGLTAACHSHQDFCASLDSPRTVAEQSPMRKLALFLHFLFKDLQLISSYKEWSATVALFIGDCSATVRGLVGDCSGTV